MLELTRDQFKEMFGKKPGELFDLKKILTPKHRIEAMQQPNPNLMRVRREFGTMVSSNPKLKPIIYAIDVGYFVDKDGFKAVIEHIIIFDDQAEQDLARIEASVHAETQQWNQN